MSFGDRVEHNQQSTGVKLVLSPQRLCPRVHYHHVVR